MPTTDLKAAVKEPKIRVSLALTRFLAFPHGLEAFAAAVAVAWAVAYWILEPADPVQAPFASLAAPILAVTGTAGLIALTLRAQRVRAIGSLLAFQTWGVLAVLTLHDAQPGMAQAVGFYVALAVTELALYVRTRLRLDCRDRQVANIIAGALAESSLSATSFSANISARQGKDARGNPEDPA